MFGRLGTGSRIVSRTGCTSAVTPQTEIVTAAFREPINVILQFGDGFSLRSDNCVLCRKPRLHDIPDDLGERRDDTAKAKQNAENPFDRDVH